MFLGALLFALTSKRKRYNPKTRFRQLMKAEGGLVCLYCGSTDNLTTDHIIPKSKGGSNRSENFQILCARCNKKKGNRLPNEDFSEALKEALLKTKLKSNKL